MSIYFEFSEPQNGWLDVTVRDFEKEVTICASHTPCDSLENIADVLLALQNNESDQEVEFSLEPEYALWKFFIEGENFRLEVFKDSKADTSIAFIAPLSFQIAPQPVELEHRAKSQVVPRGHSKSFEQIVPGEV